MLRFTPSLYPSSPYSRRHVIAAAAWLCSAACGGFAPQPQADSLAPASAAESSQAASPRGPDGSSEAPSPLAKRSHSEPVVRRQKAAALAEGDASTSSPKPLFALQASGPLRAGEPFVLRCLAAGGSGGPGEVRFVARRLGGTWAEESDRGRLSTVTSKAPRKPEEGLRALGPSHVLERAGRYALGCEERAADGSWLASQAQEVLVAAGPATDWHLTLHRQGPCFHQNRALPMTYRAWDAYGNIVFPVALDIDVSPPGLVTRNNSGGLLFAREGEYDVTFTAVGPSKERLAARTEHVRIDSTPPSINISSPARGATLLSSDYNQVLVGTLHDQRNAVVSFCVEGQPVALTKSTNACPSGACYEFAVPYRSRWGLNVLHAQATDACGNTAVLVQSFLQSPDFAPVLERRNEEANQTLVGDSLRHAVQATLAQDLWDEGDETSEHDLRHLIEVALVNGGLNERLPSSLVEGAFGGASVLRDGPLRMAKPRVDRLELVNGGFRVQITLANVELPVLARGLRLWPSYALRALVGVPQVTLDALAMVHMGENGPEVAICEQCVEATFTGGGPRVTVRRNDPETSRLQRFFAPVWDWLLARATPVMVEALVARVRTDITREVTKILTGLKLGHALDVPPPLRTRLEIQSGIDDVHFARTGKDASCSLSLYSQVEVPKSTFPLPVRMPTNAPSATLAGPIRSPSTPAPAKSFSELIAASASPAISSSNGDNGNDTFAIAISDNLINQIFWSLWASGALHTRDARSALDKFHKSGAPSATALRPVGSSPLDAADGHFYFLTPPVVMPSAFPGEVRIGVGDVYTEFDIDMWAMGDSTAPPGTKHLSACVFFSLGMRAKLGVDNQRRSLKIASLEASHLHIQVVNVVDPPAVMAINYKLETWIRNTMPDLLKHALVNVPLPNLQIGRLPGVPEDAAWALEKVSLIRAPNAQETILRGRFGALLQ